MAYQRVATLASLGEAITSLAQSLEDERDFTAAYVAQGKPATGKIVLAQEYSATDRAARQVSALADRIGAKYPTQTRARAAVVLASIDDLGNLRKEATTTQLPALVVIEKYAAMIDDALEMDDEIAQGGGDASLADAVRVLGLVSRIKEEASRQRAILDVAFTSGRFLPGTLSKLTAAQAQEQGNLAVFDSSATVGQRQEYLDTVSGSLTSRALSQEQGAISRASRGGSLVTAPTTADDWYGAMSDTIDRMRTVEQDLAGSVATRARSLLHDAMSWALAVTLAILLVLALALVLTIFVARTMVRPLARLRAGALEVAGVSLPQMVRRLSETGGADLPPDVTPIDVDTTDEIGEVARAFDQVHREALRLAANEAMLRANVNAMFVNLSQRSQSLVERQIQLIDDLEQDEEDAGRLANLFQLDHLATRMRRNSENLLVLAGQETRRQWDSPVVLIDVLRAALSEIEHFNRLSLDIQPGIAVHGRVVNDVVHLVAELAENATSYSPDDSPVRVSGDLLPGGGLLLDITDRGAGMRTQDLARANWRLDNPPVVDVEVSRRMGLFVVARLAARHGIRVRLRPSQDGGLTALVWLPGDLVVKEAIEAQAGLRRFTASLDHASEKAISTRPKTMAEKVAAAIAAARAPRFGASLEQSLEQSRERSAGAAGLVERLGAGWPAAARSVLSAPVRAAAADVAVESAAVSTGGFGKLGGFGEMAEPSLPPSGAASGIGQAVVPVDASAAATGRLPIFEAVESDWFRRGRPPSDAHTGSDPPRPDVRDDAARAAGWTSPADEGWRAAEAAMDPAAGGTTPAGLPKRIPRANLVPGTIRAAKPAAGMPARSADAVRERFGSFQRGVRAGHAAAYRRRRGPPAGGPPAGGPVAGGPVAGGGSDEQEESEEDA